LFTPTPLKRILFFLLSDFLISLFTLYFAYNLRFNFQIPSDFLDNFFVVFSILFVLKVSVFINFRLYRTAWRFFSLYEVKKIIFAHLIVYMVFSIIFLIFNEQMSPLARSIIIIDFMLSLVFITFLRLLKRIISESKKNTDYKNTLIIGADSFVKTLINNNKNLKYTPVAIVDKNKNLKNTYILNLKVYPLEDLQKIIKSKSIEAVIICKEYSQKELITQLSHIKPNSF
jgi:UDP-N-acetyl-D-glucosamine 4,6-dehydratase